MSSDLQPELKYESLKSMRWWTDSSEAVQSIQQGAPVPIGGSPNGENGTRPGFVADEKIQTEHMVTVLTEAMQTADGPRETVYGHPLDHFTRTGRMWGAILGIPDIPPESVALMFDADKTIRLTETPGHRDSLVDKCGYSRCYEKVVEEKAARAQRESHTREP